MTKQLSVSLPVAKQIRSMASTSNFNRNIYCAFAYM